MRSLILLIVSLLVAGPAWGQEAAATPADWTPVDQTVSDYDPTQVSLRRMEPGIGVFARQTLYEPTRPATWSAMGVPTVGGEYGLALPSEYMYRAPGINAMVVKPEYLVRTGPKPEDIAYNKVPVAEEHYLTLASPGMVYNLIPQLNEPAVTPVSDGWQDTRVDGRLWAVPVATPTNTALRGDGSDFATPTDPRETDGWVDAATYFRQLREQQR